MKPRLAEQRSRALTVVRNPATVVVTLFLLVLPAVVQAQFIFSTNNDAITITGYNGPGGVVVIPNTTNGYAVTGIGEYAFEDCTNLTSVTIPSSITNIGAGPFLGCASLTNISVNAGNPSYSSITNVLFDKGQDTLIEYPEGLTNGTYGIPDSVTGIGEYAFASCSSLTNMFLSVSNVGEFAFFECTGLTGVTVTRQLDSSASGAINIGAEAFMYCTSLTNVSMASTVTNIGDLAFAFCTSLTSVTIPSSVTNIGDLAFAFCTNLTSAYFESNAPPNDGTAFYGDPDAVVYYLPGTTGWGPTFGGAPTVEEPTPASEFYYETYNGSITITGYNGPAGAVAIPAFINGYPVTSIGGEGPVFRPNVTSVTIPDTVTNIGFQAFSLCGNLTSVTIPDSVTSIGALAFIGCERLTGVTIPGSVTSIGDEAFHGCGLTSVTIDNGVTSIGSEAFSECTGLTSITIPGSVTSIGYDAFAHCTSLTSVTIDNGVTSIGQAAFLGCASLTGATIPNSVTNIGVGAFQQCTSLSSVTIPASVTSIGVNAFVVCTSLTNISVAAANPAYSSINGILFDKAYDTLVQYPAGLTSSAYTIPNSVTTIGYNALAYCTSLTSAYFQGNAPPDDGTAFSGDPTTVYYLPGTTGWGATFGSVPAVLWNPQGTALTTAGGQFGFNITGPTNATIVVEACTNLANPVWVPVSTNVLAGGTSPFSDPSWTNNLSRFYRFAAP